MKERIKKYVSGIADRIRRDDWISMKNLLEGLEVYGYKLPGNVKDAYKNPEPYLAEMERKLFEDTMKMIDESYSINIEDYVFLKGKEIEEIKNKLVEKKLRNVTGKKYSIDEELKKDLESYNEEKKKDIRKKFVKRGIFISYKDLEELANYYKNLDSNEIIEKYKRRKAYLDEKKKEFLSYRQKYQNESNFTNRMKRYLKSGKEYAGVGISKFGNWLKKAFLYTLTIPSMLTGILYDRNFVKNYEMYNLARVAKEEQKEEKKEKANTSEQK
ncbi:MAG: hypothetical protein QXJ14_00405 [Candidatus Aenigmatarchaeota archaeon]